jgi:hypothetical protein
MRVGLALLPVSALLVLVTIAVAESSGVALVGAVPTENLAEAAATGEAATVVRLVGAGQNPRGVIAARPGVTGLALVTPVEAAVLAGDAGMVQLLDRLGAIVGDDRLKVACLARDLDEAPIAEFLVPSGLSCEPGAAVAALRSRQP